METFILSRAIYVGFSAFNELKEFLSLSEQHKHPLLTTNYLCGQYAFYAATSRDSIKINTFKDELKLLQEIGVNFDRCAALEVAVSLKRMLNNDQCKLNWIV
ncbi:TPA: hypothetical protein ACGIK9_002875 [Acinetobacter baumannii]|uniref:hypothetical protein n=1 Tax=Acinetobacter baumannii TaxID=470 RepID=UPI00338E1DC2